MGTIAGRTCRTRRIKALRSNAFQLTVPVMRSTSHILDLPKEGEFPWSSEDSIIQACVCWNRSDSGCFSNAALQACQDDGLSPLLRDCVLHSLKASFQDDGFKHTY